jgi:hypothetical protein
MKLFNVGRVALVVNQRGVLVSLHSNGHQFNGTIARDGAVEWATKSFPRALVTALDMTQPNAEVVVIQEAS